MTDRLPDTPEALAAALAGAVVELKPDRVAVLARRALELKVPPQYAITEGLARGMKLVGERFARGSYFVPEVLLASKAMYAGFDILRDGMSGPAESRGRVALGVVRGDIHDIGKNIVKVMVEAAGFEVIDLGRNVADEEFVRAAEAGCRVIGMSSLMTTTMPRMGRVIAALDRAGLRPGVGAVVGGAPVTEGFARDIGADGFAPDAHTAVTLVERLAGRSLDHSDTEQEESGSESGRGSRS